MTTRQNSADEALQTSFRTQAMGLFARVRAVVHSGHQPEVRDRLAVESRRHGRIRKGAAEYIREIRGKDRMYRQQDPPSRMERLCGRDNRRFLRRAALAGGEHKVVEEWQQEQRVKLQRELPSFSHAVEYHIDILTGEDVMLCGITETSYSEILVKIVENAVRELGKPSMRDLSATNLSFDEWERFRRGLSREAARVARYSRMSDDAIRLEAARLPGMGGVADEAPPKDAVANP